MQPKLTGCLYEKQYRTLFLPLLYVDFFNRDNLKKRTGWFHSILFKYGIVFHSFVDNTTPNSVFTFGSSVFSFFHEFRLLYEQHKCLRSYIWNERGSHERGTYNVSCALFILTYWEYPEYTWDVNKSFRKIRLREAIFSNFVGLLLWI